MKVVYHPAARTEFRRAARRYEQERAGLGLAFIASVREAETFVAEHPDAGTPLESNRRYLVRRFPYSIIYRRQSHLLIVLAVAHARRRPGYWRDRQ